MSKNRKQPSIFIRQGRSFGDSNRQRFLDSQQKIGRKPGWPMSDELGGNDRSFPSSGLDLTIREVGHVFSDEMLRVCTIVEFRHILQQH